MKKTLAISLLGGTVSAAAKTLGVTHSAISQWPEELTTRMEDRVHGALARKALGMQQEPNGSDIDTQIKPPVVAA